MGNTKELPPPAKTLLVYAAYGWAAERRWFSPAGRPVMPPTGEYAPRLAALLTKPGGMDELRAYTEKGMAAWGVDPSIIAVVKPAFASPDLAQGLAMLLRPWQNSTESRAKIAPAPPQPAPSAQQTDPALTQRKSIKLRFSGPS
jgi:hypothetical protein